MQNEHSFKYYWYLDVYTKIWKKEGELKFERKKKG
jgi:hypothetical protein